MPTASLAEDKPKPAWLRAACAAFLFASAFLPAYATPASAADPAAADCDAAAIARTLQPVPARNALPAGAQALWLSRALIRWPGATPAARYRLYHARGAGLRIDGGHVLGADGALELQAAAGPPPPALEQRFRYAGAGGLLALAASDQAKLPGLAGGQFLLAAEDAEGRLRQAAGLQIAGLLDDLFAAAVQSPELGGRPARQGSVYRLWAPTAQQVRLCIYPDAHAKASAVQAMQADAATGVWTLARPEDDRGRYYLYLVDVQVPGVGLVRNRVTDPYSLSLGTDSLRTYFADLADPALAPAGWDARPGPRLAAPTDMVIYELHVRDFSANDASVPAAHRGKYTAFTDIGSSGMRHLRALAEAGLTDVHLLPVFDLASVPERGCSTPAIAAPERGDDAGPQAAVAKEAARDCFNWGYDPFHFSAPEGSYASNSDDGAARIREFRAMVQALHGIGLRVGMDVVYNHTTASGQDARSVLDRIVPGYYHRLDANGAVERSTCCANTATENAMMARLMIDSAETWVRGYGIDSFRFDLMGHQPRAAMEALQQRVDAAAGRHVELIGEGWNFGEVADGKRFVQASQLSLANSGIGSFSDRARDAIRGGSAGDSGTALRDNQGYVNGLVYAPNAAGAKRDPEALLQAADLVRTGLAGTLRDYRMTTADGRIRRLGDLRYGNQPAGYAARPGEVVNYIENHDNQTLWDIDAWRLPPGTPSAERARVQLLAAALTAFSQGVAYFHAGVDLLRSKSLDRNSFDSGDWFNRLDFSYRDNYFGTGLPPKQDNGRDWDRMRPLLKDPEMRAAPEDIAFMRDAFRDLLRIRASSTLFRLRTTDDVMQRLSFENAGPDQAPTLIDGHLDGRDLEGANFREILYLVNVAPEAQSLLLPAQAGKRWVLHPVQRAPNAADARARTATVSPAGVFTVPARTAVVWVIE